VLVSEPVTGEWLDKWGEPMADYEVRVIEGDDWRHSEEALDYLGFTREHLGSDMYQAVSCDTCGALFLRSLHNQRAHRRLCGWDNGSPAHA
jgi:hypothetical protein